MRACFLLSICLFFYLASAEWKEPIALHTVRYSIAYQQTYLDPSTGKAHILACISEDRYNNMYVGLKPNGDMHKTFWTEKYANNYPNSASIIGADNGKNIFIAMTLYNSSYYDIFFTESEDNGETWSPLILPRGNNLVDYLYRSYPSLVYFPTGKLVLFYAKRDGGIVVVTREAGSKTWSDEIALDIPLCRSSDSYSTIAGGLIPQDASKFTLVLLTVCPQTYSIIIGEMKSDAKEWTFYENSKFTSPRLTLKLPIVHIEGTNKFYSAYASSNNYYIPAGTIFEYTLGGKWEKLYTFPYAEQDSHSLTAYIRKSELNLLYMVSGYNYANDERGVLQNIIAGDKWGRTRLPPPIFGDWSGKVSVHYFKDELIAIGRNTTKTLSAQRYVFTETQ